MNIQNGVLFLLDTLADGLLGLIEVLKLQQAIDVVFVKELIVVPLIQLLVIQLGLVVFAILKVLGGQLLIRIGLGE
jgi:hypothetical protein